MTSIKEILILAALVLTAWATASIPYHSTPVLDMEICDNARDDDGDGWIDLNDPDCDCPLPSPTSLIPNPSFEDKTCCPGNNSQMYCASEWLQASIPTTDYLHACGWTGWPDLPAPLPFPDGQGCIGFRDGRPGASGNGPQPNWKEYAGVCLTEPMRIGEIYRVEFYVGFSHPQHSPPINIAFYGASSCMNLPFDEEDAEFGCPTNDVGRGWVELGKVRVVGANSWQKAIIEWSPSRHIEALAIGPDCERKPSHTPYYYFLDNLIVAEREEFDFNIRASGNPCIGEAALEIPERDSFRYQWYKDGVALLGETGSQIRGALEEGLYQARLSSPEDCSITEAYPFRYPVRHTSREVQICDGDHYAFNGRNLTESGVYLDTLKTTGACDSIVELRLTIAKAAADTVYAKIFGSEVWTAGGRRFDQPGEYSLHFNSSDHCDSLVYLILDRYKAYIPSAFSPNDDGVNDFFTIYGDGEIEEVSELQIFNRWGAQVFAARGFVPGSPVGRWDGRYAGRPAPAGVYVYQAQIVFDDGNVRALTGALTLVK